MESIGTAETAEDAELALTRLSANSAVSAVHLASGPIIPRKKMPGFSPQDRSTHLRRGRTFPTAEPVTTATISLGGREQGGAFSLQFIPRAEGGVAHRFCDRGD